MQARDSTVEIARSSRTLRSSRPESTVRNHALTSVIGYSWTAVGVLELGAVNTDAAGISGQPPRLMSAGRRVDCFGQFGHGVLHSSVVVAVGVVNTGSEW